MSQSPSPEAAKQLEAMAVAADMYMPLSPGGADAASGSGFNASLGGSPDDVGASVPAADFYQQIDGVPGNGAPATAGQVAYSSLGAPSPGIGATGAPEPSLGTPTDGGVMDQKPGSEDGTTGEAAVEAAPAVFSDPTARDWNSEYLAILEMPYSQSEERKRMRGELNAEFEAEAQRVAKRIVDELGVAAAQRTVQAVDVGGVAGGEKYIHNGILYKFAKDFAGIYGNWNLVEEKRNGGKGSIFLCCLVVVACCP